MNNKQTKAVLRDIEALESMKDPGHIMDLHACIPSDAADCSGCPLDMGNMYGGCCAGLLRAARAYYDMYRAGLCSKQAMSRRYATLADWMRRRLLDETAETVSFLPTCKWSISNESCIWCTNTKSEYFNGPCSKRCEEAAE